MNYPDDREHSPYPPQQPYQQPGANSSYYGVGAHQEKPGQSPAPGGPEGEKGLGSTVIGATGGGILGHKLGHGVLGTAGGALAGAAGMNIVNKMCVLVPFLICLL